MWRLIATYYGQIMYYSEDCMREVGILTYDNISPNKALTNAGEWKNEM